MRGYSYRLFIYNNYYHYLTVILPDSHLTTGAVKRIRILSKTTEPMNIKNINRSTNNVNIR